MSDGKERETTEKKEEAKNEHIVNQEEEKREGSSQPQESNKEDKTKNEPILNQKDEGGDTRIPQESEKEANGANDDAEEYTVDEEIIEKLSVGFLSNCLPDLQKAKGALSEVLQSQTVLQENLHNENSKLKIGEDVEETMAKAKLYHSKLLNLKREMNSLAERSHKMKKRGLKLHQMKQKEELQRKDQEEREKQREEMLTAKVAKKRSSSQSKS